MTAGLIGTGLLYGIAFTLPSMVVIHGICINYLQAKEGLDFSEMQNKLETELAKAKDKAMEAKQRAEQLNKRNADLATPSITPTAKQDSPLLTHCPQCKAPIVEGDAFCGECGCKL